MRAFAYVTHKGKGMQIVHMARDGAHIVGANTGLQVRKQYHDTDVLFVAVVVGNYELRLCPTEVKRVADALMAASCESRVIDK